MVEAVRPVVYTAIPKYLVYYNLEIGSFVERQGFAANTPWQYAPYMADKVDYGNLKSSLYSLLDASDEMWIFGEKEGFCPRLEEGTISGVGLTDGVVEEIGFCLENNIKMKVFRIDAETGDISRRSSSYMRVEKFKEELEI